jgi:hypothetical protein
MTFTVFHRTWWRENPEWPDGLEPHAGKRTIIARNIETESEAREICRKWNATHKPGRLSRKAEFEHQDAHVRSNRGV